MNASLTSTVEKLRQLKLEMFAVYLEELAIKDPKRAAIMAEDFEKMADNELAIRLERRVKRYINEAHFTRIQTVDTFDFNYNQTTKKLMKRYLRLFEADLLMEGVGAVFVGPSGLGKTHLARALGYAACQRGQKALFKPCSTILNTLAAAEVAKDLGREIQKLVSPALLIIDELAYVSMGHEEANMFFHVISRRHDRNRPTVVTTNKPFSEWNQAFHGDAIAHAIVDRLTERAEIFLLEGKSYRQTHRKGLD